VLLINLLNTSKKRDRCFPVSDEKAKSQKDGELAQYY
jgi:hypothetical protein